MRTDAGFQVTNLDPTDTLGLLFWGLVGICIAFHLMRLMVNWIPAKMFVIGVMLEIVATLNIFFKALER